MRFDIILIYLAIINVVGAIVNIADKAKAKADKWRIKERTLWIIAILGGAPLSYITMKLIRHKTKHKSFMIIMPVLSVIDIFVIAYCLLQYI